MALKPGNVGLLMSAKCCSLKAPVLQRTIAFKLHVRRTPLPPSKNRIRCPGKTRSTRDEQPSLNPATETKRNQLEHGSQVEQDSNELHASHIFTARLISGAVGGAISQTLVAPLEFARLQIMMGGKQSVLSILQSTVRREGFGALWRGNSLTLLRMVPSKAIDMAVSSAILSATGSAAAAGGAAGFSATLATYPLETLRSRMACSKAETGLALLQATVRKEGYGAFYRGLGPSLVAIVPYAAVSLFAFDALNKVYSSFEEKTTRRSSSPWATFAFGAIAGSLATTATFPIELCRKQATLSL
ncbi:hypothetical protein CYMTET_43472 [Cymbomonas tetramitiformis]|uniref:Uncharacterized protein n=1 Tax=Cymbomonas tetramitiformis TaxID=36881 RepID=A0AAE0C467_9CHLO|nr:hypothetical protein CYMTET_43472 [Cymbomonas tetramitiformis]